MRVLWFSITPARYGKYASNGGGWIESLQRVVAEIHEIELGIAFVSQESSVPPVVEQDGVTYYPMQMHRNMLQRWYDKWTYRQIDAVTIRKSLEVVAQFKPDVVQVFGSEWCFGLLQELVDVPVVIHMQGCWPVCQNIRQSLNGTWMQKYLPQWNRPRRMLNHMLDEHLMKERVRREEQILSSGRFFMGRTVWDKDLIELYAKHAQYGYCSEALRLPFVQCKRKWTYTEHRVKKLVSTGIAVEIKGYDVVLRAAQLLRKYADFDFEWHLLGPTRTQMKRFEARTGIRCEEVGVIPCGNVGPDDMIAKLFESDCYVHASYIDNSPNAVCEAQYLGLPVISTNAGGIPSLFAKEYVQEWLVTPNDPYQLSAKIKRMLTNRSCMEEASQNNWSIARERHSDQCIGESLLQNYNKMLGR